MPKSDSRAAAFDIGFFRNIGIALLALTLLTGSITLNLTLNSDLFLPVKIETNVTE
jgi:hypothetical protein